MSLNRPVERNKLNHLVLNIQIKDNFFLKKSEKGMRSMKEWPGRLGNGPEGKC